MKMRLAAVTLTAFVLGATVMNAQDGQMGGRQPGQGQRRGNGQGRGMGAGGGGMMGGPRVMGVVQSVTGKQIMVKDEDGTIWTVDVGDNTRVMKQRDAAKFEEIKAGQAVVAAGMAEPGKKEIHAVFISMLSAEQATQIAEAAAKMKENMGKTLLIGKITKMDETKLTILRMDGVEQTAMVDENTMLRKGGGMGAMGGRPGGGQTGAGASPAAAAAPKDGEPITLADIKVGDNVSGPGSVKDGSFLFKELHVGGGGGRGGQRRGAGAAGGAAPAPQE